jgi:hypothetical protein
MFFILKLNIYFIKFKFIIIFIKLILFNSLYYLLFYVIYIDLLIFSIIIPLIVCVAYVTLVERKAIG